MNEKIGKKIYNFIDEYFSSDINYIHGTDDYGNDDPDRVSFYSNDFDDNDFAFYWYGENYWAETKQGMELKRLSPIVILSDNKRELLDGMFGDAWKKPFMIWFKNKFGFDVKSIGD